MSADRTVRVRYRQRISITSEVTSSDFGASLAMMTAHTIERKAPPPANATGFGPRATENRTRPITAPITKDGPWDRNENPRAVRLSSDPVATFPSADCSIAAAIRGKLIRTVLGCMARVRATMETAGISISTDFNVRRNCHGGRSGGGDSSGGSAGGGSRDRGSRGVRRSHAATRTAATPAAANPRTRRAVAHGNSPPVGGGGGVTATTCIENVFTLSCVYVSAGVTLPTTMRNVWFPTPTATNDGAYTTADAPGARGPRRWA